MKLYYLQDKRNIIGNCMLWWAKDGRGYTTKIDKAHIWTAEELIERGYNDPKHPKYRIWEKDYIDSKVEATIDVQKTNWEEAGL